MIDNLSKWQCKDSFTSFFTYFSFNQVMIQSTKSQKDENIQSLQVFVSKQKHKRMQNQKLSDAVVPQNGT